MSAYRASVTKNTTTEQAAGRAPRRRGRILARVALAVTTLACALCMGASSAHADPGNTVTTKNGTTVVQSVTSTNVRQGTDGYTFAAPAPISTIVINPSISSTAAREAATLTFLGDSNNRGLRKLDSSNTVVYDDTQSPYTQLQAGTYTSFDGNLFSFTYNGMATLQDGSSADVVITYSNMKIYLSNEADPTSYHGTRSIASGNMLITGTTGFNNLNDTLKRQNSIYGLTIDAKIQVMKDGQPVEGTFFYPMTDIDVVRGSGWHFGKLPNAAENGNFSERVQVNGGIMRDGKGYGIYVPDADGKDEASEVQVKGYKPAITDLSGANQIELFHPTASDNAAGSSGSEGSFYSGFAAVVDNSQGLSLGLTSSGGVVATTNYYIKTFMLAGTAPDNNPIVHSIVATRTGGGTIQTTTNGNLDGSLNDDGEVLGPNHPRTAQTSVVPQGKTVVYTMKPTDGYRLKAVKVGDGTGISESQLTEINISGMNVDDERMTLLATNKEGVLKRVSEKEYTFTFPENNYDHKIHVEYAADYHFTKEWVGDPASELSLTATPYTYNKATGRFVLAGGINPVTFTAKATSQGVTSNTSGGKTTWSITYPSEGVEANGWPALPIEPNGNMNDDNMYYWFVTETPPSGYTLEGYVNANTSFTNFKESDSAAKATVNAYTDRAYMSFYEGEGGKITNRRKAEVKGVKQWDDYDNGFGTRKDVTMHLSATVGGVTYSDVLPARTIAKGATGDGLTVTWGAGEGYAGKVTTGTGDTAVTTDAWVYASASDLPGGRTYTRNPDGITYHDEAGVTYYVNQLPAFDDNGNKITYAVAEDDVEGYEKEAVGSLQVSDEGDTTKAITYTQTHKNKLKSKEFTTSLAVSKLLEGKAAPEGLFSFTLTPVDTKDNSGTVLVEAADTPRPASLTASNAGSTVDGGRGSAVTFGPITFKYEDMLERDASNNVTGVATTRTFTYEVREDNPADSKYDRDSSVKTIQLTVTNYKDGTLGVTQSPAANTLSAEFNNSLRKFNLTAEKAWDGGDASEHTQVKVKLRKMVDGVTSDYLQERTIQASDDWKTTWENIPRYEQRADGTWAPVTYSIFEESINGYSTKVTSTAKDTFRIETTNSGDAWEALKGEQSLTGEQQSLTVRLLRNGVPYGDEKTLSGDNWTAEWTNLPEVDENGTGVVYLYDYEVVDPASPDGGYAAMKEAWRPQVAGYDPSVNLTVTNKKRYLKVNAEKIWNDGGDASKRGGFTMTLERRNTDGEVLVGNWTYTVSDDEAKASGSPEFKKTWGTGSMGDAKIPVSTGGQTNVYVLTESTVPDYYTESVQASGTITLGIQTDASLVAQWSARGDAAKPTFAVELLCNGEVIETQTLSAANQWRCSWADKPTVDADGTVLVYDWRVAERPADWTFSTTGFEDQYGESKVGSTDLYNIKVKNTLLTDVTVAKKWVKQSLQNVDVELLRWKGDGDPTDNDYNSAEIDWNNWERVGNAYRHTFAQKANDDDYIKSGDPGYQNPGNGERYTYEEHVFTRLPAFDAASETPKQYHYRVHELTTGTFFTTTYERVTNPNEVSVAVNTSTFEANGQALVGVVKNIEGRTWLSGEQHSFTITPTGDNKDAAPKPHKAKADGTKDTDVPEDSPTVLVASSAASVGGTARFAYFDPIFYETTETDADVTFTYAITEDIPGDAVGTSKSDGPTITYADASREPGFDRTAYTWTKGGVTYSTEAATVKVNFKVQNTQISSTVTYENLPAGAIAPTFTNTYDAKKDVTFPVAKRIRDYAGKAGDGFVFTVTPVGDAPAPKAGTVELDYEDDDPEIHGSVKQTNGTSPTIPVSLSDLNLTDAATGLKYGTFIYEVRENHGTNTRFSYTDRPVYVRLTVRDKGDGTLESTATYYRDATCKTAVPAADEGAATFENSVVRNVQVTKEWHGPVMCDTTLRVERRYADGSWGPAALTSGEANPFTILRNRFASLPETDVTTDTAGREVRSITHTFDGLPAYDAGGEKIAYRVVETAPVASDGFAVTYRSDNGKAADAGYAVATDGAVLDSNKITVTNTYDHGTTAQIAVVKELLGRTWLAPEVDTYNFVLTAVRNGTSAAAADLARVPMPGGTHASADAQYSVLTSQVGTAEKPTGATPAMKTGTKVSYADEYLALFAPITVDVSDLTFDSSTGRMKGDFYYTLQEVRPASQTPAGSAFAVIGSSERFVYQGVTYAAGAVHTVHVKVTDDMRGNVVSRTYFDEDANGIGTWFTPVVTNHYDASGTGKARIVKYILGDRPWSSSDSFSFKMRPVGNAPWRYPSGAATDANGALDISLAGGAAGAPNYRTVDTPELTFRLSDLTRTTTADGLDEDGGTISYSAGAGDGFAGTPVPAGLKYDTFLYAISETGGVDDKLIYDTDTEYVRFTVIDKGDGTLDVSAEYLPATDAAPREFAAGDPVGAPFTNIEKKDINVTKVWDGLPTADTVVALKQAELSDADLAAADVLADGATTETRTWGHIWKAAESDKVDSSNALNPYTSGAPVAAGKTLVGYDGKVFEVSQGSSVAGFASGSGTTYFEVPSGYSIIKVEQDYLKVPDGYFPAQVNGETFFVPNDERQMWKTIDYRTFTTTEFATGSEVTERFRGLPMQVQRTENNVIVAKHVVYYVDEMPNAALYTTTYATTNVGGTDGSVATRTVVVTNRSTYASTGTASVRVIKDLQGRAWHKNVADEEGGLSQQEDQFRFTLTPLGRAQYDEATGAEKADLLTDSIPMPAGSTSVASMDVSESSDWRTDSQREAGFANINISLSDLTHAADGTWKGDFYYRLAEHIGDDYVALEKVTDEGELKTIQNYHTIAGEKYKPVSLTWGAATAEQRQAHAWWLDTERSIAFTSNTWGVHVHAQDAGNGTIATTITYEDNSSESSDYITTAPAYTNYYDASGLSHTAIIKHIAGRDWETAEGEADAKATKQADGSVTLAGDAFRFKFQQVGGAVMDPTTGTHDYTDLNDGIVVDADTWMTPAATPTSVGIAGINNRTDRAIRSGEGIYRLDQLTYNNDHNRYEGSFVHVINEVESHAENGAVVWPKVADMEYDKTNVYMQTLVWDRGDGTLGTWHRFFTDATCSASSEIVGHEVWVDESGYPTVNQSLDANATETVTVGSNTVTIPTYTDEDGKVYTRVNAAYFFNSRTIEIPVTKQWVGMPVESVTLHLQRALVPADKPIDDINDAYVMGVEGDASQPGFADANAQGTSNFETWRAVGHVTTLDRGDFLKADGTPDYDALAGGGESNTVTRTYAGSESGGTMRPAIDGFNKDLPMFVVNDGKIGRAGDAVGTLYRAIYRLVEDDTSDTYKPAFASRDTGRATNENYFVRSGSLVVTNTTTATNEANITAGKQLVDRTWSDSDAFTYTLTPLGKGTYHTADTAAAYNSEHNLHEGDEGYVRAGDLVTTTTGTGDAARTKATLATDGSGQAVTAGVPMPEAARQVEGYDKALGSNQAVATIKTAPLGEGEHLARFGSITYGTDILELNPTGRHLQGDYYYEMREDIPAGAIAMERRAAEGDETRKTATFAISGNTATPDANGSTLTYERAKTLDGFDLGAYYWKVPYDATKTAEQNRVAGYDGILYDGTVHTVHVQVRENRTDRLQVVVAYDETDQSDTATGLAFTPVFTNHYETEVPIAFNLVKSVRGGNWGDIEHGSADDLRFFFEIHPTSGAPFRAPEGVRVIEATDPLTEEGVFQKMSDGGVLVLLRVLGTDFGNQSDQLRTLPPMLVRKSDLGKTVTSAGKDASGRGLTYSDGTAVPVGVAYDRLVYYLKETEPEDAYANVKYDTDEEYVQVTIVDRRDGTLDYQLKYYKDRACTQLRRVEETSGGQTSVVDDTKAPFTNALETELVVRKEWSGVPNATATVVLERNEINLEGLKRGTTINISGMTDDETPIEFGGTWYAVPNSVLSADGNWKRDWRGDATHEFSQSDIGADGTAEWRVGGLITQDIRTDMDGDRPGQWTNYGYVYRITETSPEVGTSTDSVKSISYGTNDADRYSYTTHKTAKATGDKTPALVVTNESNYATAGDASVSVVKQLMGRQWTAGDDFEFVIEPKGVGRYDENGELQSTPKTDDDAKALAQATIAQGQDKAHAKVDAARFVSANEYSADFPKLSYSLDSTKLTRTESGAYVADYYYTVREKIDSAAVGLRELTSEEVALPDFATREHRIFNGKTYEVTTDTYGASPTAHTFWLDRSDGVVYTNESHDVRVHLTDNGNGTLSSQVSYDGRPAGGFVPVFTNYYDASGKVAIKVRKHIVGGNDAGAYNGAYRFELTPMPGAAWNTNTNALHTTVTLDDATRNDGESDFGEGGDFKADGWYYLSDLNGASTGSFVYAIHEVDPANEATYLKDDRNGNGVADALQYKVGDGLETATHIRGLDYDGKTIYAKLTIADDGKGSLRPKLEFFTSPDCSPASLMTDASGAPAQAAQFDNARLRDITVDKVWVGDAVSDVTITLQRSEDGTTWSDAATATIAKDATGEQLRAKFEDLPAYTASGTEISWRVVEAAGENFSSDAAAPAGKAVPRLGQPGEGEVTVTNTNTTKIEFKGTKEWVDGGRDHTADAAAPTLTLRRTTGAVPEGGHAADDATGIETVAVDGTNVTLEWSADKTSFTYAGLPMFDTEGHHYAYWAVEDQVSGYEAPTYHNPGAGAHTDRIENGGMVTNAIHQEKVSVQGEKTWSHGDNPADARPTHATVRLLANGAPVSGKEIVLDGTADAAAGTTVESGEYEAWKFRFSDLDKYDAAGAEITYTVREDHVAGYRSEVTGSAAAGFTVTNTFTSNTLGDILRVSKTVEVPAGQDAWTWPSDADFVFYLLDAGNTANITQPMPAGSVFDNETYKRVDVTRAGQGATFGPINYDTPGTYTYRVREMTPAEASTEQQPGMTYDTEVYTIVVTVADDMSISTRATRSDGTELERTGAGGTYDLAFANHYDKTRVDYVMVAEKAYMDRSRLAEDGTALDVIGEASGRFAFTMRPVGATAADAPMPTDYYSSATGTGLQGSGANRVYYARNDSYRVLFEQDASHALEFTAEMAGKTFAYELAEVIPDDAVYVGDGFWYNAADETVYDGVIHTRTLEVSMPDGVLTIGTSGGAHTDKMLNPERGTRYADAKGTPTVPVPDDLGSNPMYPRHKNSAPNFLNFKNPTIDVTATKVWDDANNQDGRRPESMAFKIRRADRQTPVTDVYGHELTEAELTQAIAGTAEGTLTATWKDLPRFERIDSDSTASNPRYRRIRYEVTEVDDSGMTTTPAGYHARTTGDDEHGFTITNTHVPAEVDVNVTKAWEDVDDRDALRPSVVTFHIDQRLDNKTAADYRAAQVAEATSGWKASWSGLPAKWGGQDLSYALREDAVFGYEAGDFVEGDSSVRATLRWAEGAERPSSVNVTLVTETGDSTSRTATLSEANGWTAVFDGINKDVAPRYSVYASLTNAQADASDLAVAVVKNYTITNTHVPATTTVRARKIWVDGADKSSRADVRLTLAATADGTDVTDRVMAESGQSATKTIARDAEGDGLAVAWANMPESIVLEGVTHQVEYSLSEEAIDGYALTIAGNAAEGFTVTNTLVGTTKVEGTKVWVDGGLIHDNPHDVTLQLWRKSAKGGTTAELTSYMPEWDGNGWSFADLPSYDAEGYAYRYYVVERSVMGYETIYDNGEGGPTDRALNGATITNRVIDHPLAFTATKAWDDNDNEEGLRTDVTLHLERTVEGDAAPTRMDARYDRHIAADASGDALTVTWDDLPRLDEGRPITYTVVEDAVTGYDTTVEGDQERGFTVVNRRETGTVAVRVTKAWDDNDNSERLRPEAVTFHLMAQTAAGWHKDMGTAEARASSSWQAQWANMPTHRNGEKITYSVIEDSVPGYFVSDTSEMALAASGAGTTYECTVTNKRAVPTGRVSVEKIWDDAENQDGMREEVVLRLEALGADGTWRCAQAGGSDVPDKLMGTDTSARFVRNVSIGADGRLADADGTQDDDSAAIWSGLPTERTLTGASLTSAEAGTENGAQVTANADGQNATGALAANAASADTRDGAQADAEPDAQAAAQGDASGSGSVSGNEPDAASGGSEGAATDGGGSAGQSADGASGSHETSSGSTAAESSATPGTTTPSTSGDAGSGVTTQSDGTSPSGGRQPSLLGALASFLSPRRAYADETVPVIYRVVEYHVEHRDGGDVWVAGAPDGYVAVTTQTGNGTFVVTNIHEPEARDVTVRKAWDDAKMPAGRQRPSSVTVQLLADGEALGAPVTLTGDDWTHVWREMPVRRAGQEIEYTAEEVGVPTGYTSSGAPSGDAYVITNVYNGPVTVTAIKLWNDMAGKSIEPGDGVRTPEVRMQLFKNGEPYGDALTVPDSAEATDDKMRVTWPDLESYEGGEENVYTVEETVVDAKDGENTLTATQTSMSDTITRDGTVTFVNTLKVVEPEPEPKPEPTPDDPNKIIKVTYVDHLLGEDGKGGSLKTSTGAEELVKVFKVRAGDLNVANLRTPDENPLTSAPLETAADDERASAEAAASELSTQELSTQEEVRVTHDGSSESHKGYEFTGWTVNRDQFGDYVMVAHHKPTSEAHTVWVDGQTGETWDGQPGDPAHDGLRFVGWKQVTDAAGNIINVAQYEAVPNEASGSGTRGSGTTIQTPIGPLSASSVRGSAPLVTPAAARAVSPLAQTSDDTNMVPAIVLAVAATGLLVAAVVIRRRK